MIDIVFEPRFVELLHDLIESGDPVCESIVRCRTSSSRPRCISSADCCAFVFTGTKRIEGRLTASQIASASAASFLLRLR
jgi:hypothetical protein